MESKVTQEEIARHHNRFRGQMCGFIEALGLTAKQEHALIVQVKSLSYALQKSIVEMHGWRA